MTLRESLGGDVKRLYEQVDALLDSEDSVELERAVRNVVGREPATDRREGSIWLVMSTGITAVWLTEQARVFGLVMLPTAIVAGLLVVYFEWRGKVLSRIRDEGYDGRKRV